MRALGVVEADTSYMSCPRGRGLIMPFLGQSLRMHSATSAAWFSQRAFRLTPEPSLYSQGKARHPASGVDRHGKSVLKVAASWANAREEIRVFRSESGVPECGFPIFLGGKQPLLPS